MDKLTEYSLLIVLSSFISSLSQVMLKKSAEKEYPSKIKEYLNPLVITAYIIFAGCTLLTMYGLKVVPLSMSPVLEAMGYIFITLFGYIFFKERFTRRQAAGMLLVLAGIAVYSAG